MDKGFQSQVTLENISHNNYRILVITVGSYLVFTYYI